MPARNVNDFTIRVATINGSGSQSSNLVLTNAIARLGIPVAPKNVFPSNIEGLPTWFDVRVSALGYQCRARDFDVLVALNATTWQQDVAGVKSGGAVVHEESYPVKGDTMREDLTYYAVPFATLAKEHFGDKGDLRKYLMNMIYVGVLAQLLEIPPATIEESLRGQFRSKPKAVELNMTAINVGFEYAREHLEKHDPWRLVPMTGKTEGLLFMEGNRAAALGCVMGGCTVAAWYPITPSSSLCEYFIQYSDKYRVDQKTGERNVAIVQAEDELAAAGIVFGAGWGGARAMTSTSGPGVSLMAEFAGYGYFAEVPGVIFDVQRAGPSTGLPTRTMQGDLSFTYTLSHGDTKHLVLMPSTVAEAYEFAMESFDLAERFQTPVFVLSDLDLGMNAWLTPPLKLPREAVRSRQSLRRRRSLIDEVVGPLSRRRQGRHSVSHAAGNEAPQRRLLYARYRARRRGPLLGDARRLAAQSRPARSQARHGTQRRTGAGRRREERRESGDPRVRDDPPRRR